MKATKATLTKARVLIVTKLIDHGHSIESALELGRSKGLSDVRIMFDIAHVAIPYNVWKSDDLDDNNIETVLRRIFGLPRGGVVRESC